MLADLTVTLHAPKVGHFVSPGDRCAGHVVVVPIGIPPACDEQADVFALTSDAVGLLVRPKTDADHKRSVGTVLVAGGSRGMTGAAAMAALGALRSGAGLVHCILPADLVGEKPYLEVINVAAPGARPPGPRRPGRRARRDGPPQGDGARPRHGPRRRHGRPGARARRGSSPTCRS